MNRTKQICSLSALLLACSSFALSQKSSAPVDKSNLYYRALLASLDKMAESWGSIDESSDDQMRIDYHHMIVEANDDITEELPAQLGDHKVEYLGYQELVDRYHKLRKRFAILSIHPLRNDGARLKINITVYWITFKDGQLIHALSDWSNVTFRYDCEKHAFVIDAVTLGGI